MDSPNNDPYERARFASGIKTAAIVVILGVVAVVADHAFYVAPRAASPTAVSAAAAPAKLSSDGFALPDSLRPHAGDVAPPPPSF